MIKTSSMNMVWLGLLIAIGTVALVQTATITQLHIAIPCLVLLFLLRHNKNPLAQFFFISIASFLALRYLSWRTFNTISFHDPISFVVAILLYLAEIYGITMFFASNFVNIFPLKRESCASSLPPEEWPTVDILVPSYNETAQILKVTLLAASNIRYPKDKLNIYLLDDGGTEQKRNDPDSQQSAVAWERHRTLMKLCEDIGVHYLTRGRNEHAKAGNINAGLKRTKGELVLILDADHVPTVDILENTIGFFERDKKLFMVQTPHFFVTPDPIEKNLQLFGKMPSENEMFYSSIQHGLDFWNATFFCGSAAVLRRRFLEEVGGINTKTVTEDAETALALHAKGYNSAYISRPMISGLQPETYSAFIGQRIRWTQGMIQIFLLRNPLLLRGLTLPQRLCYFSSAFFWFFPFARCVFLLAPATHLLFDLKIYDATAMQFTAYAIPYLIGIMLVSNSLFGKVRWTFISELYEIMQSLFSLVAIFKVFRNLSAPKFLVTPKGENISEDFISGLAAPFYIIYVITVLAILVGFYHLLALPEKKEFITITLCWEIFNLLILNAAIGALLERKQRRSSPRMPVNLHASLVIEGLPPINSYIKEASATGASIFISNIHYPLIRKGMQAQLIFHNEALRKTSTLRASIGTAQINSDNSSVGIGLEFLTHSNQEFAEAVSLAYGDSERWIRFQEKRTLSEPGIIKAFYLLTKLGAEHIAQHFWMLLKLAYLKLTESIPAIKRISNQLKRMTHG